MGSATAMSGLPDSALAMYAQPSPNYAQPSSNYTQPSSNYAQPSSNPGSLMAVSALAGGLPANSLKMNVGVPPGVAWGFETSAQVRAVKRAPW